MTQQTGTSYLIVLSNPAGEDESAFHDWYNNTHVREVTEVDGILSAQRFRFCDKQVRENPASDLVRQYRYLALYEIEHGREEQVIAGLLQAMPNFNWQPVIDMNLGSMVIESITDRISR